MSAREESLRQLAERIGHEFADLSLLDRALRHASTGNETKLNYERLEFLGDAILGFLVAEELFRMEPEIKEGRLTETRSNLVSRGPLSEVARSLDMWGPTLVSSDFIPSLIFRRVSSTTSSMAATRADSRFQMLGTSKGLLYKRSCPKSAATCWANVRS